MLLYSRFRLLFPACILALLLLVLFFRSSPTFAKIRKSTSEVPLPGQDISQKIPTQSEGKNGISAPKYLAGIPKSAGQDYSRTLVIASTTKEDTKWLTHLADTPNLSTAVYVVDDPNAPLTVPKNKGHEVMVYLTYIIDHYDQLSDVTMFMHAHRITWHNNDLMFSDAVEMIQRLSSQKVTRDGYMNLRCHLDPGCPDHIHPSIADDKDGNIPEAVVIGRAWLELFPDAQVPPKVLSQPCCAQFALSKARIQNLPLNRYLFFRQWLLKTELDDRLSGRVWEYVWQYVFAGVEEFCPIESICYCDGYGICFGGEDKYQEWFATRKKSRELADLKESLGDDESVQDQKLQLQVQLTGLELKMSTSKKDAFLRGEKPSNRAAEAGREWKEGDWN
jgi:Protein of unknown function (DUF3431)